MSEWKYNNGVVPEDVTADTRLEVEYRDGAILVWSPHTGTPNNDPDLWTFEDEGFVDCDILRYRIVE